jgi:predicted nucleic acid-binding protein
VDVLLIDIKIARNFGDIFSSLRKKGRPIPTNDIWIAACCLSVGGVLLSADSHFLEVDQIQVTFLKE